MLKRPSLLLVLVPAAGILLLLSQRQYCPVWIHVYWQLLRHNSSKNHLSARILV